MEPESITPVILTRNEQANIGRTLEGLSWARDIVVVDSFSDDRTLDIIGGYPNVRVFQRRFDTHANQWNYAISGTSVSTEWVLALDADYVVTGQLLQELQGLAPPAAVAGYRVRFTYCVDGKPLRSGIYPPVTVLYRRAAARYVQEGHTQRVIIEGPVKDLEGRMLHDDRKPLADWLRAQERYARLEADLLARNNWRELRISDRLRKALVLAPFAVFFYCLFLRGGFFDGRKGLSYALQRMLAETMLSLALLRSEKGDS